MEKICYNSGKKACKGSNFFYQAKEKYLNGDYILHKLDNYGQNIDIAIHLNSKTTKNIEIISGWKVHPLGKIMCATPYGGK